MTLFLEKKTSTTQLKQIAFDPFKYNERTFKFFISIFLMIEDEIRPFRKGEIEYFLFGEKR